MLKENIEMSTTPTFTKDIQPLFREEDRDAMIFAFDLWEYPDVSQHADLILERIEDGSMPCDEEWPQDRVELFRAWIEAGKPA
jgi:hypothetical protein